MKKIYCLGQLAVLAIILLMFAKAVEAVGKWWNKPSRGGGTLERFLRGALDFAKDTNHAVAKALGITDFWAAILLIFCIAILAKMKK
jgi:hypothetical protein